MLLILVMEHILHIKKKCPHSDHVLANYNSLDAQNAKVDEQFGDIIAIVFIRVRDAQCQNDRDNNNHSDSEDSSPVFSTFLAFKLPVLILHNIMLIRVKVHLVEHE